MSDSEVSSTGGESTPSPELFKLTLAELTEENKEKAAKIKAEANKAFVGTSVSGRPSIRHQESLHLASPLPSGSAGADFCYFSFGHLSFAAHGFRKAADLYTQALDRNPFDPTLWCNRAYARIKLEEHGYALSDASTDFS
jgi:hypothetical protein